MKPRVARILEVGPYPPPMAGWSIRIRFVREHLEAQGHVCEALNIGKRRKIPSDEYITVNGPFDYIRKTFRYAVRGYTIHMHANGDGPIGMALALIAAFAGLVSFRRIVLSFHAGIDQRYFPRDRSGRMLPALYLLFKLPKRILCDNEAVREKILEFGPPPDKVVAVQTFGSDYVMGDDVPLPEHVEDFMARREPLIHTYFFLREGFHLETFVEGVRRLVDRYPDFGVVNAGAMEDHEPPAKERILGLIEELEVGEHICFADDLTHEQFLTLTRRSRLYLRTPTSDGECASVLESLTLGVPVVASENGTRPDSVVTYRHDDADDLCARVVQVLENHEEARAGIIRPDVRDTIAEEAAVLIEASVG